MCSFPLSSLKFKDETIFTTFGDKIYRFNHESSPSISKVCIGDVLAAKSQDNDGSSIEENVQILAFHNWESENKLIACDTRKNVLVYNAKDLKLEKIFLLHKPATAVIACTKSRTILVADRAGNVIRFDYDNGENFGKGTTILGHVSVIFDLILSEDEKFLLTSDRDEKIRVSHFPNVYNIESFCLGHKRYVFSLAWLQTTTEKNLLLSGSG
uniref:Uncharacterized protein n=1 Tax=Romanomermis culicivorax TaxID=13658 RepID=A0A915JZA8_ROMCU